MSEVRDIQRSVLLALVCLGIAGCYDIDFGDVLDCSAERRCPGGYQCVEHVCVAGGDQGRLDALRSDLGIDEPRCGDGEKAPSELCDGDELGEQTCESLCYGKGTLRCASDCTFDVSGCALPGFVRVTHGSFTMGSPDSELCRERESEVAHRVDLTYDFEMQATEVTQAQYIALLGQRPFYRLDCEECPADEITWYAAAAYCTALSVQQGLTPCYVKGGSGKTCSENDECRSAGEACVQGACVTYTVAAAYAGSSLLDCKGYRLPTEAEWEYAYRGGTQTAFHGGPITSCFGLEAESLAPFAWFNETAVDTYPGRSQPVARRKPNGYCLFDMAGNLMEWTHDWYQLSLGQYPTTNPIGPTSGSTHARRGGSVIDPAHMQRAAFRRDPWTPDRQNANTGFRCARRL